MLVIRITINLDLYQNLVYINIRLFGIKTLKIKISIIGLYIQINNHKKIKSLSIILSKKDEYLLMQIKQNILDKLYFDDIQVVSNIGISNSSTSALLIAFLNNICDFAEYKLKENNSDISFSYANGVDFFNKVIDISLDIKVYFTLFYLAFAIIISFYRRNKYVKKW